MPDDDSNLDSLHRRGKPADIQSKREGDSVIVAVAGEIDLATADHWSRFRSAVGPDHVHQGSQLRRADVPTSPGRRRCA